MDKTTTKVANAVHAVIREIGLADKPSALAEILNRRKIRTARGKDWSGHTLGVFLSRYPFIEDATVAPQTSAAGDTDTTPIPEGRPEDTTGAFQDDESHDDTTGIPDADLPVSHDTTIPATQLDLETIATLMDIAQWWKTRGAEMAMQNVSFEDVEPEPTYRPSFPGRRQNTGIRVNTRLMRDALSKAKRGREKTKTGGGLSPLIEHLFWRYLGYDPKYLADED